MDKKEPSNDPPNRPAIPTPGVPETIMIKTGVYSHPILFGIGVFISIILYEYYYCRHLCGIDTATCRERRRDVVFWLSALLLPLMFWAKYREGRVIVAVRAYEEQLREKERERVAAAAAGGEKKGEEKEKGALS